MKRSAPPTRRSTRACVRRKKAQEKASELVGGDPGVQEERKAAEAAQALDLMSTPLLKALPMVLSSGFLYQHDCIVAASTCQNWYRLWKEVEDQFPEDSKVEVFVENISSRNDGRPEFIHENGLLTEITSSPRFVRQVFDKVNELRVKVKGKKGPAALKKCRENLLVWGVGVRFAEVSYWGRTVRNSGGMMIRYGIIGNSYVRNVEAIRLSKELQLWTVKGIREKTWEKDWLPLYDGQPLWP